jgi:drug/metabolite transporter (DMT)-like permease
MISTTDALLLFMAIIWGTNFAVVKRALSEMLPLAFNALRFSLASIFLFLAMILSEGKFLLDKKDFKGIFLLGLI